MRVRVRVKVRVKVRVRVSLAPGVIAHLRLEPAHLSSK